MGAERDRLLERALETLSGAVVPRTSAALDAARVAFLNERLPFSRLLELQNDWFHARVDLERAEAERFAVWARWQEVARPGTAPPTANRSRNPRYSHELFRHAVFRVVVCLLLLLVALGCGAPASEKASDGSVPARCTSSTVSRTGPGTVRSAI
ncbi:MAG: hypothetical protein R2862_12650 [Thermoanaerobaculia bacterium]